jgi:hypothetical protein
MMPSNSAMSMCAFYSRLLRTPILPSSIFLFDVVFSVDFLAMFLHFSLSSKSLVLFFYSCNFWLSFSSCCYCISRSALASMVLLANVSSASDIRFFGSIFTSSCAYSITGAAFFLRLRLSYSSRLVDLAFSIAFLLPYLIRAAYCLDC